MTEKTKIGKTPQNYVESKNYTEYLENLAKDKQIINPILSEKEISDFALETYNELYKSRQIMYELQEELGRKGFEHPSNYKQKVEIIAMNLAKTFTINGYETANKVREHIITKTMQDPNYFKK